MKKIININFQGRVIPIEETAYDALKAYVESLRKYFRNEDGRDEIINDIESRIAELFSERLKRGTACITDDDVQSVIASIGRPEDLEEQEAEMSGSSTGNSNSSAGYTGNDSSTTGSTENAGKANTNTGYTSTGYQQQYNQRSGRLVRNADDKIIAGVCSGLANNMRIDPSIMRILFVLFFGVTFWIYIILWIVVPVQSVRTNITKRLYRDPEHRVIGGVCGGLAAYFNTEIWIPRIIFGLPLLISIVNGAFRGPWFSFHYFPGFITGSLVTTLILVYIVLWIVLPEAMTTSERLEMRGEKIDLNSIRDTVKEDLQDMKSRAEKFGTEVKEAAQNIGSKSAAMGQQAGQRMQAVGSEAIPVARRGASGIGNAIGIFFRIFFMFIMGCILVAMLGGLVGLFASAMTVMPFKDYLLDGAWQGLLAWGALILFLGVPIIAIIVWLIRRIVGVRTKNHYIGYTFGALWIVGLFCVIGLGVDIKRNFDYGQRIPQDYTIAQPASGKLTVRVANSTSRYYGSWGNPGSWFDFFNLSGDSLVVKNVRVRLERSNDSLYHVSSFKCSNGSSNNQAEELARSISFQVTQTDSTLYLANGFLVPSGQKFRNQHVLVVIQIPVGKRYIVDRSVNRRYHWFMIEGRSYGGNWDDWNSDDNESYGYTEGVEYVMTVDGPKRVNETNERKRRNRRDNDDDNNNNN
ncbi:MAG: PspC domain-containing protein, partial [Bacteroidetes bacterium]|nr:PspC domain-containing protein [Bacteroidota bacterium]